MRATYLEDNMVKERETEIGGIGNRNYKDSIFRMIFKDKKSFKEMYESLTNNVLKGDLIYYDTENVMSTENYRNDVSFLTDDGRAIVLIELNLLEM